MFKFWRWTYARLYVRSARKWGKADSPKWSAAFGLSLVIVVNLITAAYVLAAAFGASSRFRGHELVLGVVGLLVFIAVSWTYVIRKRANGLIREFKRQSEVQTRREERKLWGYILGSFAALFVVPLLVRLLGGD